MGEQQQREMQVRIEALERELKAAREHAGELEQSLKAERERAEQARAELEPLRERLEILERQRERLAELEQALDEAQVMSAMLEKERDQALARLETETGTLREERDRLIVRVAELEESLQGLREDTLREREAAEATQAALQKELEVVRASLQRARKGKGDGGDVADREALEAEIASLRAELERNAAAMEEARAARETLDNERARFESALQQIEAGAAAREQALLAELEQLRTVTTADLEAMQQEVQRLRSALREARAAAADSEEVERLRILLTEARVEAERYRREYESLRESAILPGEDAELIAQLRQELEAIGARIEEATRSRDAALEEVARLRAELESRSAVAQDPSEGGGAQADGSERGSGRRRGLFGRILGRNEND